MVGPVPSFSSARHSHVAGGKKRSVLIPGKGSGGLKAKPPKPTPKKPVVKKPSLKSELHSATGGGRHPTKPRKPSAKRTTKSVLVPSHAKPSAHKPAVHKRAAHKPAAHKPAVHKPKKPAASPKSVLHRAARPKKSVLVPARGAKHPQHGRGHAPAHPSPGAEKGKLLGQLKHPKPVKPKRGVKSPASAKRAGAMAKRIKLKRRGRGRAA